MRATLGAAAGRASEAAGWSSPMFAGLHRRDEHVRRRRRCTSVSAAQQVWKFGLVPEEVGEFVAEYGWRLVEQAGPDYYLRHLHPADGPHLAASQIEWTAYAEKTADTP